MQFKDRISIIQSQYDEFASKVPKVKAVVKCFILDLHKIKNEDGGQSQFVNKMTTLIRAKSLISFKDVLNDDNISFSHNGIDYSVDKFSAINDFSGKVKYYEVYLVQVKNANR